jgi:MFS transporter, DHA3 family, multidrug efflux protein
MMTTVLVDQERGPEVEAAQRTFRHLLLNTLVSGVTSSFLWFALTFWAYLETGSVVATAIIGAAFSLSSAVFAPWFGTYVDHHRKHQAMTLATTVSVSCFALATAVFVLVDAGTLLRFGSPWFWLLVGATLLGSVAGSLRSIAMGTCVTLLVPESSRDRANGLVGSTTGVAFAITSVFSGLVIGRLGMGWALYLALGLTVACLLHLRTITIPEPEPAPLAEGEERKHLDVRAAVESIKAVPGLSMLIALAAFNNLLGGVFMALMDAYGLELVSVETWGLLWGGISMFFIAGGLVVARFGLGKDPLRLLVLCNLVNWTVCSLFPVRHSIVPLTIGMVVWLTMVPIIEAAEQTVLQRAIPYERQGRVFGFAQLVENAAAPITAILMGPLAERVFMPFMTDGSGADAIGGWFGTGPARGLALLFCLAGVLGVVVTLLARASRAYRRLSESWSAAPAPA